VCVTAQQPWFSRHRLLKTTFSEVAQLALLIDTVILEGHFVGIGNRRLEFDYF